MPGYFLCQNDGPIRTSVKYEYKDDLEECFGPVTDIQTCTALLCEGGSKTCCQATEHEPIEVTVSCYSIKPRQFLRTKTHVVSIEIFFRSKIFGIRVSWILSLPGGSPDINILDRNSSL